MSSALRFRQKQSQQYQSGKAQQSRGEHCPDEVHHREPVVVVYVEILGISDRSEHTSEVRSSGLEDYSEYAAALVFNAAEYHQRERDKSNECDVIRHKHRREEAQQDKYQSEAADSASLS